MAERKVGKADLPATWDKPFVNISVLCPHSPHGAHTATGDRRRSCPAVDGHGRRYPLPLPSPAIPAESLTMLPPKIVSKNLEKDSWCGSPPHGHDPRVRPVPPVGHGLCGDLAT